MAFYSGTKYDSEAYSTMVALLKEIALKWDIRIINLWDDPGMNSVSPEDYAKYMADPIHPTLEGYCKWWSPYIEREICSIIKI